MTAHRTTADPCYCNDCVGVPARRARPKSRRCAGYIPTEDYGSICNDCGRGAEKHRDFNRNGGVW